MGKYAKALAAGVGVFYSAYTIAVQAGSPAGDGITSHEWIGVAVSTLVTALLVYLVPNDPPAPPAR